MICKRKSKLNSSKYYFVSLTIQLNSHLFTQLSDQTVLFLAIEFSMSFVCTQFKCQSFIWPIDKTLSNSTTPGQSRPRSNGNEEVLHIPQNPSITGTSLSDCPGYDTKSFWDIAPLQRFSQRILQPQPTGLNYTRILHAFF